MNWKRGVVLAGLAVGLVFMGGCKGKGGVPGGGTQGGGPGKSGQGYGRQKPREFDVYIYVNPQDSSECLADWPKGTLWQGQLHTVKWFSDDGGDYTVDFTQGHHAGQKSPFATDKFTVQGSNGGSGQQVSGDLQPGARGYYDFVISGTLNGKPCKYAGDPGYIVKP